MNTCYDLVMKAMRFATEAHKGQVRKYTGEPYVIHCLEVSIAVQYSSFRVDCSDVAAALLHDTIEDTATTYEDLHREFGKAVADLVLEVTDKSKPEHGNRAMRKAIDRHHLAQASRDAQTIKLCDLINNSRTILEHDPDFAVVYLEEKRLLLEVLTKGNPDRRAEAAEIVRSGLANLEARATEGYGMLREGGK